MNTRANDATPRDAGRQLNIGVNFRMSEVNALLTYSVIKETESAINYHNDYEISTNKTINTARAISHAACSAASQQNINILVTMTHSGSTARMAARYRPAARIVAMTPFKKICRQL